MIRQFCPPVKVNTITCLNFVGMPIYELDPYFMAFPPAEHAEADGLLAIGGSLREDWLLTAYAAGIFPWFNAGDPIMWWSPNPRFVLFPKKIMIQKSLRPYLNNKDYSFKLDTAFETVINRCAEIPRHGQNGTWITQHMKAAYIDLHKIGMAHSAEIWLEGDLLGGLYGVGIGGAFFGESMYSEKKNASKLALIKLSEWLSNRSFRFLDCQIYSNHLVRMGAELIDRSDFLIELEKAMTQSSLKGKWIADS